MSRWTIDHHLARFIMRQSIRILLASSVTVAALGIGCQRVPDSKAPGGILSGNEFARNRSARGTVLDTSPTGPGGSSSIDASHSSAGPTGAGGTTAAGSASGAIGTGAAAP